MPNDKRPKVGEADPETRRKKLRELLDEPTKGTGVAAKAVKEKPKKKPTFGDAVREGIGIGTPKRMRYGPKGETEDEITSK